MKEFDLDSAKRKFAETLTFYKENGQLKNGYCYSIIHQNNTILYHISPDKTTSEPEYISIENGFYKNPNTPNEQILIIRSPKKTFKIGISPHSHYFYTLNDALKSTQSWAHTDLMTKIEPDNENIENALSTFGPITSKIWVSKDTIYYLNKPIGLRKGTTFILNDFALPTLQNALTNFNITFIK